MNLSFAAALLVFGSLLALVAALSGAMRGTVLSASVLSLALEIVLAALGLVHVDPRSPSIVELIELALTLTLFSDGMFVERELLRRHRGPVLRALAIAMPITLLLLALAAKALFGSLAWAEAFLLGAVLSATDPVVTSAVVTSRRVPESVRHTLNLESGLNDGLALPLSSSSSSSPSPAATRAPKPPNWSGRRPWAEFSALRLAPSAAASIRGFPPAGSPHATRASTRSASPWSPSASPK
jgi:sodium/hydrogen antiporter